ncbi:MAG TPA: maleylpyruvate isomerase family mycothiol-dependent enzyme [Acidimicrobiales bacterium]
MANDARQLIEAMDEVWKSTLDAVADLTDDEWAAPSPCPGWTVKDVASHMIWGTLIQRGEEQPAVEVPDDLPHVRDDFGRYMEQAIVERADRSGDQVRAELASSATATIDRHRSLSDDELDVEQPGPLEMSVTLRKFLPIQILDQWMHEQDIRQALSRPGHLEGLAAEVTRDRFVHGWTRVIPTKVAVDGPTPVAVHITGPSARSFGFDLAEAGPPVGVPDQPAVTITLPFADFVSLAGGRDVPRTIEIGGDAELGEQIIAAATFTP